MQDSDGAGLSKATLVKSELKKKGAELWKQIVKKKLLLCLKRKKSLLKEITAEDGSRRAPIICQALCLAFGIHYLLNLPKQFFRLLL